MDDNAKIIDIEPLESSRTPTPEAAYEVPTDAANNSKSAPKQHAQYIPRQQQRTYTVMLESNTGSSSIFRRIAGLVLLLFGLICVLVGIPLLILPGPGLLVIALGVALVTGGARMLFGPGRPRHNTNTRATQNPTTTV